MAVTLCSTRVVLADDHTLIRSGLKRLIERMPGILIVGEASNGRELLEVMQTVKPDLVILDIAMPGLSGLDLLPLVRRQHPTTEILILSAHANPEYVLRAMNRGARGYLTKDSSPVELESAIRSILNGQPYFRENLQPGPANPEEPARNYNEPDLTVLTDRQRQILQLISESRSTKEIAFHLNISAKTVEAHRAQLMERLRIYDIAGLVRFSIRAGLITAHSV